LNKIERPPDAPLVPPQARQSEIGDRRSKDDDSSRFTAEQASMSNPETILHSCPAERA